mgnify:CR=1 FL=1
MAGDTPPPLPQTPAEPSIEPVSGNPDGPELDGSALDEQAIEADLSAAFIARGQSPYSPEARRLHAAQLRAKALPLPRPMRTGPLSGSTMGRLLSVWLAMGTSTQPAMPGCRMGPPADSE